MLGLELGYSRVKGSIYVNIRIDKPVIQNWKYTWFIKSDTIE